jgi:hypothetical protein
MNTNNGLSLAYPPQDCACPLDLENTALLPPFFDQPISVHGPAFSFLTVQRGQAA